MPDEDDHGGEQHGEDVVHEDAQGREDAECGDRHDGGHGCGQKGHARGEGGVEHRQCRLRGSGSESNL